MKVLYKARTLQNLYLKTQKEFHLFTSLMNILCMRIFLIVYVLGALNLDI